MKELLIKLLLQTITLMTPEIRNILCDMLKSFREKAKKSKNPWDDIIADVLIYIFNCKD